MCVCGGGGGSLFHAGVNGRSWRLVKAWYSNLSAVVRTGTTSTSIPILCGVQQGSVLSLTFFLVIMDELLLRLSERDCGASILHFDSNNLCTYHALSLSLS